MSLRKLILLIIFCWGWADSQHHEGFKLQMKDGSFFIDDGSGEVPVEVMDKGPDLTNLQDGEINSNHAKSNLEDSLKILDKTLSDLGNDSDNKMPFSELDVSNQREKINELRRLLDESNLVDPLRGDESEMKVPSEENASANRRVVDPTRNNSYEKTSKISDADLLKIREVMDREYGKSILLIPKNELKSFYQLVRECPFDESLRSVNPMANQNVDDRLTGQKTLKGLGKFRYPQESWAPASLVEHQNFTQDDPKQNQDKNNQQAIMQDFTQFLKEMNINEKSTPSKQIGFKQNEGNPSSRNSKLDVYQEPVSLEEVRDFLQSLSEDKFQLKQSLRRWFEKNNELPQQGHFNSRRSPQPSASKEKDQKSQRKSPLKSNKPIYQRISRSHSPNYRKRKHVKRNRLEHEAETKDPIGFSEDQNKNDNRGWKRQILDTGFIQEDEKDVVSSERHSRADFIR